MRHLNNNGLVKLSLPFNDKHNQMIRPANDRQVSEQDQTKVIQNWAIHKRRRHLKKSAFFSGFPPM